MPSSLHHVWLDRLYTTILKAPQALAILDQLKASGIAVLVFGPAQSLIPAVKSLLKDKTHQLVVQTFNGFLTLTKGEVLAQSKSIAICCCISGELGTIRQCQLNICRYVRLLLDFP